MQWKKYWEKTLLAMYISFFLKEGEEEKQTNNNKQTNKTRVYHNWDELVNMHDIYRPILRALINNEGNEDA